MQLNPLGDSELRVSEICLGTMTFGQQNSVKEAHEQLDYALDHGINFIDTAEMYPVPAQAETQGRTESFVGEWLAKKPRDRVVVATKIAGPGRPISWVRGGSLAINRANVRAAVDDSLRRLKTDYIDLYRIHWPDRYVPQFGETVYDPKVAREHGLSLAQLALAFVRSRWFVKSTIVGATSLTQLEENVGSTAVRLDDATLSAIEAVHTRFPSPAP